MSKHISTSWQMHQNVKDSCTPFNTKTYKCSQLSFRIDLLRSYFLTNKNVVQWNLTNHMKEPVMFDPLVSIKTCLEESTLTITKYEEVMLVLLAFRF